MAKAVKIVAVPAHALPIKYVKRKIHFFDLNIDFKDDFNPPSNSDKFMGFFSIITRLAETKNNMRYQPVMDAKVFMQDVKFIDAEKKITGKMLYVKMDVFPELINLLTDKTTDIEADEDNGIVETTHFIIDYSKPQKKMVLEYNHAGAKIGDFMTYFQLLGIELNAIKNVNYILRVKDEIDKLKEKIGTCSTIDVKVHKNNIAQIESVDKGLFSSIRDIRKQFEADYIELKLRFSYKKRKTPQKIQGSITNVLESLVEDKNKLLLFDTFKIRALDRSNNFSMALFDLLEEKVESEVSVQRKPKHKVVISVDMFELLKQELLNQNI